MESEIRPGRILKGWINPKIKVRKWRREGERGLFVKGLMRKGEVGIIGGGRLVKDAAIDRPPYDAIRTWCYQVKKGLHLCPVNLDRKTWHSVFLMNHSCEPTFGVISMATFVALRDIKNEDATYDYAMTDVDYEGMECEPAPVMECACGTARCRKIITGKDWQRKDLQKRYKGYFSKLVQEVIGEANRAAVTR